MLTNASILQALAVPMTDERGIDVVAVIAKATYVKRGQALVLADEQGPVRAQDVPSDKKSLESGRESSVRYPSDVCGSKAGADVVVVASAISPKRVAALDVAVRTPEKTVSIRVHGERVFYKGVSRMQISEGAPFEQAPITYERAFGGRSRDGLVVDWRNPVGRGAHRSLGELDGMPAPCLEDPARPIEAGRDSVPICFGAIPTWWQPRRDLFGTMDEAWQAERMPLPPVDFDQRSRQVAHPLLQMTRPFREGDTIATTGLSGDPFVVSIPAHSPVVHVRRAKAAPLSLPLVLDTALLEPAASRMECTFRVVVPLGRGDTFLNEVRLDVDA